MQIWGHYTPYNRGHRHRSQSFGQVPSYVLPNRTNQGVQHLPREIRYPTVPPTASIRGSVVKGDVRLGPYAHVVNAIIRADEGTPFYIGANANVQDGVVIHAHSTQDWGTPQMKNLINVPGKGSFAVYLGNHVTVAHQALIHGPTYVGDNSFIGFDATIHSAKIGKNVEIGHRALIENVTIPDNVAIAPGAVITEQSQVKQHIVPLKGLNTKIAKINTELAKTYTASRANPFRLAMFHR